ncbi:MAG: hypothetical protein JO218_02640 [Burkholderiales bacterium]|nr:hypothetical protein [Burkholderiales bacterium]
MIHLICTLEPARIDWLPQLVAHYRELGVEQFLFSLQQEPSVDEATRNQHLARFAAQLRALGCDKAFSLVAPYDVWALRRHHDSLQDQFVRANDWIVWCDSDEFQVYPLKLPALTTECADKGIVMLRGVMLDHIAADGSLPPFDPARSVWDQYPRCCNVTVMLARAETRKVALSRGNIRLDVGNHAALSGETYTTAKGWVQIHHFKWHAGVLSLLAFRVQPEWRAKCAWWEESQRLLDYFAANGGRFKLTDLQTIPLDGNNLLAIPE